MIKLYFSAVFMYRIFFVLIESILTFSYTFVLKLKL